MGRRSDARPRIIATSKKLFHERGYQAVGVSELCGASDVNKGSFYHFFPSKRHLLIQVLSDSWDETGMLKSWLQKPPVSPGRALRNYLRELFAFHYAEWEASGYVRGSILGNISAEIGTADESPGNDGYETISRQPGEYFTCRCRQYCDLWSRNYRS